MRSWSSGREIIIPNRLCTKWRLSEKGRSCRVDSCRWICGRENLGKQRASRASVPTIIKEVANFKEMLNPASGRVTVRVFNIEKRSTGAFDAQDIRASRVELEGPIPQILSLPFETHQVKTADIDRNGTKDLLLYREDGSLGVVWLNGSKLEFRPEMDMLESQYSDLNLGDDGNGHTVFVVVSPGIYTNGEHGVGRLRLYVWTQQGGFKEATSRFPKYVRQHMIPDLRKEMSLEADLERVKNFQKIIAELEDLTKQAHR